jgi:hypothetical protein
METKVITHKLRNITIQYDETMAWTAQDEQLVQSYLLVHDYELHLREEMERFMQSYGSVNGKLENIRMELRLLTEKLAQLNKKGDETFDRLIIHNFQVEENFAADGEEMMQAINRYHVMMEEVHDELGTRDEAFNKHLDRFYDDKEWEDFSEINHIHCQNYTANSIDIVSFDVELDNFRTWLSEPRKHHESLIDFCNDVAHELNILQLETSVQYTLWNGILKRFEWAKLLVGREKQFGQMNLN